MSIAPARICDIAQFYSPLSGGVKRYLVDKRRQLAEMGGHHVLVVPSHRDAVTREAEGVTYEIRSPRLVGSRSYRLLIGRAQILAAVTAERPDLIEVGDPYRTAWIGLEAGRRLGIPVVANYHSDFPRAFGRTIQRFAGESVERMVMGQVDRYLARLYNRMSATVVATRRLREALEALGIERLVQISLGTDVDRFRPRDSRAAIRAELGIGADDRMLLFVGRMAREKNILNLIGSLDLLPADAPPRRLVLVGDGELRDHIRDEAARRTDVISLAYCDSVDRLADLYSAADLFVHPGINETFGLVALEAQACGTPVMVVRDGGVEEAIAGERHPLIATDRSTVALAAAIGGFLQRPEPEVDRLARRERIVRHFSADRTFARLFALYAHLIARRPEQDFPPVPGPEHEFAGSSVPSR